MVTAESPGTFEQKSVTVRLSEGFTYLVVQKLSLAATILGALGMTYKLSSKK